MWLYPVPSVAALAGWAYIFVTSGSTYLGFGLLTLMAGVAAYGISARHFRAD